MKSRILIAIIAILTTGLPVFSATPSELYDVVWDTVNSIYYDVNNRHNNLTPWKHRYDNQLKTEEDAYVAIESFIASLNDHYTVFLRPEAKKYEKMTLQGVNFEPAFYLNKKHQNYYISLIKNSPADIAGVKNGDILVKINNNCAETMSEKDMEDLLFNPDNQTLNITVKRGKKYLDFEIKRQETEISVITTEPPLFTTKIPDNIGYIYISSFNNLNTSKSFYKIIKEMKDKDGYIIDIRWNGGGVVKVAGEICNMFLKDKIIVTLVSPNGSLETVRANDVVLNDKPIVVLINGASASASEVLAGAMKDNKRAMLLGTTTFGKGIVQKRIDLPNNTGLRVTLYKYLTPNGTYIHHQGIEPDVYVDINKRDLIFKKDVQLIDAIKLINTNIQK